MLFFKFKKTNKKQTNKHLYKNAAWKMNTEIFFKHSFKKKRRKEKKKKSESNENHIKNKCIIYIINYISIILFFFKLL